MSTPSSDAAIRRLVRAQHGVVSLEQARTAGLSDETVRRRVGTRAWLPAGPRVFLVAEHEETPASRTVAAMLSVGEGAVLVGLSAAWWWDLYERPPALIDIAVGRQVRPRDGVRLRRRDIPPADRTRCRRLAVTCRPATVLDAGVALGLQGGARLMDNALLRRRVTLPALREAHHRGLGRQGATLAGKLLVLAGDGARSEAERRAHRLMRRAGIGGWSANTEIVLPGFGRALGDVVFAEEKVVLEIDGWAYHRGLRAFLLDGPRQSALAAAGWVVVRTHWHELTGDPDTFLATLRRTLAARSRSR
ncbi:very-short-patch-repair endonuclease [Actinomycetospora succinea]|uniref:Very-short-patch-repair endonuclease n=1 Tax=Actinomycetospora succinea TaxID=663603 RepID=A0A4R6VD56_9PSEU|nr:DUF559 domain-containing protein [Actinomycetospora succinea]TDQ58644.1 very-short-patch-repair endonuclease [Actinomycetospora succinea]